MAQANADLEARAEAEGRESVVIDAHLLRNVDEGEASEAGGAGGGANPTGISKADESDDIDSDDSASGDESDEEEEDDDDDDEMDTDDARQGSREVEMDVGVGVFDVHGQVGGDVGPVVERDPAVWAETGRAGKGGQKGAKGEEREEDGAGVGAGEKLGDGGR